MIELRIVLQIIGTNHAFFLYLRRLYSLLKRILNRLTVVTSLKSVYLECVAKCKRL